MSLRRKDILPPAIKHLVIAAGLTATAALLGPIPPEAAIAATLNPNAIVAPITKDSRSSRLRLNETQSADAEKQRPIYLMKFNPPAKSYLPDGVTFPFPAPNLDTNSHGRTADTSQLLYRIGDPKFTGTQSLQNDALRNIAFGRHSENDSSPFSDTEAESLAQGIMEALAANQEVRGNQDPNAPQVDNRNFRRRDLTVYHSTANGFPGIADTAVIMINQDAFGDAIILGGNFPFPSPEKRAATLAYLMAINTSSFTDVSKLVPTKDADAPEINLDVLRLGLAYLVGDHASGGGRIASDTEYQLANTNDLSNRRFHSDTDEYLRLAAKFWKRTETAAPGTINKVEWAVQKSIEQKRAANPDGNFNAPVEIDVEVIYDAFQEAFENSGINADEWLKSNHVLQLK